MAYNKDDNSELRKLQLTELDIMKLFVSICDKHHLRYFLVGGTMLGAIRHKGFIPWDDDMDAGMPRPDYEKFLSIVREELPEGYDFLNYKQNDDYHRYFSRIVNMRARVYNNSNSKEIIENVWLDIFPFDGMPKTNFGRKMHFWNMTVTRFWYHCSCFDELVNLDRPGRKRYLQNLIKFVKFTHIGSNLNTKKLMLKIERQLMKYPYDDAQYMVSFFGAYMYKEVVDKDLLGEGVYYPFEDTQFKGPEKYDAFLTQFFGDYMVPPTDDRKDKHNIRKIEYDE